MTTGVRPEEDAFGTALMDHLVGGSAWVVVERDDGFVEPHNVAASFTPFEEWASPEQEAMEGARGRVLDVGCGAGRHALYLQDRGQDVLCIDPSPGALEVCRQRGVRQVRPLTVTQLSHRVGTFDTVLMLGGNFGLFGTPKRARWLLRRFKRMTSPEARVIGESLDPLRTDRQEHLDYHAVNQRAGRPPGQVRIRVRYGRQATPWFSYLHTGPREMEEMVAGTGWRVARILDPGERTYVGILEKDRQGREPTTR